MAIETDGFLSPEIDALATRALQEFAPDLVELVRTVNRLGLSMFRAPRDVGQRDTDLFAVALLGRMLQDFEAAVLLAARGMRAQSRSMVRSTLESALYCHAAAIDLVLTLGATNKPKEGEPATARFIDALVGGHQRYRLQFARALNDVSPAEPGQPDPLGSLIQELSPLSKHGGIDLRYAVNYPRP